MAGRRCGVVTCAEGRAAAPARFARPQEHVLTLRSRAGAAGTGYGMWSARSSDGASGPGPGIRGLLGNSTGESVSAPPRRITANHSRTNSRMPVSPRAPRCAAGHAWATRATSPDSSIRSVENTQRRQKEGRKRQKPLPKPCKHRGFWYPHRDHTGATPAPHRDHAVETPGAGGRMKGEGRMKNAEGRR